MDLPGKADYQRLPHCQLPAGNGVVCRQPGGVHTVMLRNGGKGLSGSYHMNRHSCSLLPFVPQTAG